MEVNEKKIIFTSHFWILLILFVMLLFLHYPRALLIPIKIEINSFLGLERHAIERILFIIPISYAAFIFGLKGGIFCLITSLLIMVPRVFFISIYSKDALFETILTIGIGILINWWMESRRKEIGLREQALIKLEANKRELQAHVKIIEESKKSISALHSISAIINRSLLLEEVLDITMDKIKEIMDIDIVLIFFLNEDSSLLNLTSHRGTSEEFVSNISSLPIGEGFNGYVAKTGKPIFVEDITQDSRFLIKFKQKEAIKSLFIVPLKSKDNIIGTLCIAKKKIKKFTEDEKELLTLIGIEIGLAVEKSFFLKEIQKIGRRFQEIFEKANDAIWIQNESGTIISANKATSKLTGYELDELISNNISQFFKPEGILKANEVEQKLVHHIRIHQPYEQKILKKNGKQAILMLTTSLLGDEKKPIFLKIARDITVEKKMQENLRLYADQINSAYEEERKRIARELHDDTIQTLVAISRRLDNYITKSASKEKDNIEPLEKINVSIDESLIRIRRFIQDLRPPTLEFLGLFSALRELVSQMQEQSGIIMSLKTEELKFNTTPEEELLIYRIIQEAIRNVSKHSYASKSEIIIKSNKMRTMVKIGDNGKGFEVNNKLNFLEFGKLGLMGMKERAHLLGGSLDIISKQNEGTIVTLKIEHKNVQRDSLL